MLVKSINDESGEKRGAKMMIWGLSIPSPIENGKSNVGGYKEIWYHNG